ncbi:hypothetical protein V494_01952 [Pseudogymnoascus sp. VKM F-4513 (FW-928)]|nr:hypothetical protein V494_01952 [Pseudogymnoascus sp. VKM F-4513 (FW-928)]
MVATGKDSSANSDDEPLYGTRCIISTCNKPILQMDSSDEVCISCRRAAKHATTKLKARRLKPKVGETGLWTPQSEASFKNDSDSDTMKRQILSPLPSMGGPNGKGKKRKLSDADSTAEEIETSRNLKSQKVVEVTEEDSEGDSADQGSGGFHRSESPLSVSEGSPRPRDAFSPSASPRSVLMRGSLRSRSPISMSGFSTRLEDAVYPSESPVSVSFRSESPLSVSQDSPSPEDAPLPSESPRSMLMRGSSRSESPGSVSETSLRSEDAFSLSEDPPIVPERSQHAEDSISIASTSQGPENEYSGEGDQLTRPLPMPCRGSNLPSTLQPTPPSDTALKQQAKTPVILSGYRDFTDNGIVQFQPFVPFIGVDPDSIEPTLNPDSVQARRSKNPLGTESDSLGFYDMLSKYRGSDEALMAKALFDLRAKDKSYISIQAKIIARGGRKRQFGEVYSRLEVESTWSKHQNQPWRTNPVVVNRDDLPLQKIFGEFNTEDMIPVVVNGELHLTQREEYEGTRRTWRYGDGGTGKEQGYLEAQAGAWAHLAKAAI